MDLPKNNTESSTGEIHKYYAVYKCQLCGKLQRLGEAQEIPYNSLPELCAKVIQNQLFAGNPYLHQAPMHVPHKCADGNCGMSIFAGFMRAD